MKPKIFDLSICESRRRGYSAMVGLLNTEIRRVPVGRFDDDADLIHSPAHSISGLLAVLLLFGNRLLAWFCNARRRIGDIKSGNPNGERSSRRTTALELKRESAMDYLRRTPKSAELEL